MRAGPSALCAGPSSCSVGNLTNGVSCLQASASYQSWRFCLCTLPQVMDQPSVTAPTMLTIPSPLSTLPRIICVLSLPHYPASRESPPLPTLVRITATAHPCEDHPIARSPRITSIDHSPKDHLWVPHLVLWALSTSVLFATSKK